MYSENTVVYSSYIQVNTNVVLQRSSRFTSETVLDAWEETGGINNCLRALELLSASFVAVESVQLETLAEATFFVARNFEQHGIALCTNRCLEVVFTKHQSWKWYIQRCAFSYSSEAGIPISLSFLQALTHALHLKRRKYEYIMTKK